MVPSNKKESYINCYIGFYTYINTTTTINCNFTTISIKKPSNKFINVVLPEPLFAVLPTILFFSILKFILFNTFLFLTYSKFKFLISILSLKSKKLF